MTAHYSAPEQKPETLLTLYAEPTDGCVVDFLDTRGINCAAYLCGKCGLLASRGSDGLTYTDEGQCESLLFDSVDRDYEHPIGE